MFVKVKGLGGARALREPMDSNRTRKFNLIMNSKLLIFLFGNR